MPHCCIWGFQPCHYSSTNIQVGNLGHWTCCMPRAVWFLYQTRHALAYPTATNRWCCQLINYLERLALYGTCLKHHWTPPFSLQSYMSHSVMHTTGASQAPVLHLFTLYTSDFRQNFRSCYLQWFLDDSSLVGCISEGKEAECTNTADSSISMGGIHLQLTLTGPKSWWWTSADRKDWRCEHANMWN